MLDLLLDTKNNIVMSEHKLEGFLYSHHQHRLEPNFKKNCAIKWLQQSHNNQLLWEVLKNIDALLCEHQIEAVILKGLSFLGRIYSNGGERAISDIDLYLSREDEIIIKKMLTKNGFIAHSERDQWEGDNFKSLWFTPPHWPCATIELHFDLFYHRKQMNIPGVRRFAEFQNIKLLEENVEMSYLIGHLAFQHTFLKLFWLVDVDRLYRIESDQIECAKMLSIAHKWGLFRAHQMVFYVLLTFFKTPLRQDLCEAFQLSKPALWKLFLTKKFLLRGRQSGVSYYLLKHMTKDSLLTALVYDLRWIRHMIKKNLATFFSAFEF